MSTTSNVCTFTEREMLYLGEAIDARRRTPRLYVAKANSLHHKGLCRPLTRLFRFCVASLRWEGVLAFSCAAAA